MDFRKESCLWIGWERAKLRKDKARGRLSPSQLSGGKSLSVAFAPEDRFLENYR